MKTTTTKEKKVLFFIPAFPVLTETFIEREIVKLTERGKFEIIVLTLAGDAEKLPEILKNKVYYRRLNLINVLAGLIFLFTQPRLVSKMLKIVESSPRSFLDKLYLVLKSFGYAKIFQSYHPDFIFAHFMSESSTIGMLAATALKIPFGISAHAKDVTVNAELVTEKIARAKFVLVCNKNALQHLETLNQHRPSPNLHLQYHGVDFNALEKLDTPNVEKPKNSLVLSVGRLVEKKGHRYLIEAAKILKQRGIQHQTYIIGPGPLYNDLVKKIKEDGVEDCVKILGGDSGLPFKQIVSYYKNSEVLVFSGIKTEEGDEDGVPNILVEGAVFRIPLVSTDAGSASDLIENEKTGLLIPQKNPHLLADAIERLLFDKQLSGNLAENNYQKAKKMFDLDKNILEIERLLS